MIHYILIYSIITICYITYNTEMLQFQINFQILCKEDTRQKFMNKIPLHFIL